MSTWTKYQLDRRSLRQNQKAIPALTCWLPLGFCRNLGELVPVKGGIISSSLFCSRGIQYCRSHRGMAVIRMGPVPSKISQNYKRHFSLDFLVWKNWDLPNFNHYSSILRNFLVIRTTFFDFFDFFKTWTFFEKCNVQKSIVFLFDIQTPWK